VDHFEENMAVARKALQSATDEALEASFSLKANGQLLYTSKKIVDIGITLNHWVHHRGQLTVYMRLNDLAVPSIMALLLVIETLQYHSEMVYKGKEPGKWLFRIGKLSLQGVLSMSLSL
jgi:uncharacterized damage-inducible protein DinB